MQEKNQGYLVLYAMSVDTNGHVNGSLTDQAVLLVVGGPYGMNGGAFTRIWIYQL